MKYLIIFALLYGCSSPSIKTKKLLERNLVGYWSSVNGTKFNYMNIECDGSFHFMTYNIEDKGSHISEIDKSSLKTSPQMMSHYYEISQWPSRDNNHTIHIRYVSDSMLENYSSSLSKIKKTDSKEVFIFQRTENYQCPIK